MYAVDGYSLFRNDSQSSVVPRPYGGTAVFSRIDFMPGYPCCHNINGIEITTMKVTILPHVTIIGVYRSPKVPVQQLFDALNEILILCSSQFNIFICDFNVNWLYESNRSPWDNIFVNNNNYRQLVSSYTTDNNAL